MIGIFMDYYNIIFFTVDMLLIKGGHTGSEGMCNVFICPQEGYTGVQVTLFRFGLLVL